MLLLESIKNSIMKSLPGAARSGPTKFLHNRNPILTLNWTIIPKIRPLRERCTYPFRVAFLSRNVGFIQRGTKSGSESSSNSSSSKHKRPSPKKKMTTWEGRCRLPHVQVSFLRKSKVTQIKYSRQSKGELTWWYQVTFKVPLRFLSCPVQVHGVENCIRGIFSISIRGGGSLRVLGVLFSSQKLLNSQKESCFSFLFFCA